MSLSHGARAGLRALVICSLTLCFTTTACAQAKPSTQAKPTAQSVAPKSTSLAIGIGVGAPLDFEGDVTFADAIKVARAMEPAPGVSADEDGWLKGDGAILVWASGPKNNTAGTYKLKYDGRATVRVELADATLGAEVYDEKTDTSTRDVHLARDQEHFKLAFEGTTKGIKNVKLMRPISRGATQAHRLDELWYRPMKQLHRPFAWIRTMDFTATNGQNVERWQDRTRPGRWSQQNHLEGTWWQGRGAAWEYTVHMANEEQKDLWICVPLLADDEYIKNLARLIHYGSDGKNPYTSPQKNPVWAPLDKNLKLYVEYSNEIWNFGFPQWTQLLDKSRAEAKRGNTNLNFDGTTSDGDMNIRYWVRRIIEISDAFRKELGDEAMTTRVRPLFETQLGWADNYLWHGLWFVDAWYNNGDGKSHVKDPHPVSYYIWGAGGSTYPVGFPEKIDQSKSLKLEETFKGYREMFTTWTEHQRRDVDYARAFGLRRISYEGGTGMDNHTGDEFASANAAKDKSQKDPRIGAIYTDMLKRYAQLGGDAFTNFLTTHSSHGVIASYDGSSLTSPKLRAITQVLAAAKPRPTWGVALPATISAGRYRVTHRGGLIDKDEPVSMDPASWYGYTVRNTAKAKYAIRVSAGSADASGRLNVWVDGALAGTLTIASTGAPDKFTDSSAVEVTLEPGQHGVRLDGAAGTFTVNEVKIQKAR